MEDVKGLLKKISNIEKKRKRKGNIGGSGVGLGFSFGFDREVRIDGC